MTNLLAFFYSFILIPLRAWRNIPDALAAKGKKDGLGSQVQAHYSTYLFARILNIHFAYCPPEYIDHLDEKNQSEEIAQFTRQFGLERLGLSMTDVSNRKEISLDDAKAMIQAAPSLIFNKKAVLFSKSQFNHVADLKISAYEKIRTELRRVYNPVTDTSKGDKDVFTIALHVRRGDVNDVQHAHRYTSNEILLKRIKTISSRYQKNNLSFRIYLYSTGKEEEFGTEIGGLVTFRLNQNPFQSFDELVQADVLVMAKSSFSYCAGILNEGDVFYEPFWHKPLPDWLIF
jgi:hypothetical protein